MTINHPLEFIPAGLRKNFFFGFLLWAFLSVVLFGVFAKASGADTSNRIVAFELAQTPQAARGFIEAWDSRMRLRVAFELGFDYFFMPAYALSFCMGLLLARDGQKGWQVQLSSWLGWGVLAAALLDAVENYALWKELSGSIVSPYPEIAAFCASIKFALLAAGLMSIFMMLISRRMSDKRWSIRF
jgi:hypothetical protein